MCIRDRIWIEDVKHILGEPQRNGQDYGEKEAHLNYLWRGDEEGPAGIALTFEHVLLNVNAPADTAEAWKPFQNSYWLSGIQMRDGSFYDCWRWQLKEVGRVECPNCIPWDAVTTTCLAGTDDPRKCFK